MSNFLRNWKTTLLGVLALGTLGVKLAQNPLMIAQPGTIAEIAAGIGLIVAKDADKTGVASQPK